MQNVEADTTKISTHTDFKSDVGAIVVGGDYQGLGIVRNLREHNVPVYVIDHELCIGKFSRLIQGFCKCPDPRDEIRFIDFVVSLVGREKLEGWVIFPTNDVTVALLSKNKEFLSRMLRVWTPDWQAITQVYDKSLTADLAERVGVAHPRTIIGREPEDIDEGQIRFPVIVKPAIKDEFYDKTKEKAFLARDKKELIAQFARGTKVTNSKNLMIQEVIPGGSKNQYSFCSFFKNGESIADLSARRTRQHPMDFGHASTFVETMDIPEIRNTSIKLLQAINYYGLCEVEYKFDERDREYKLLEINARTWGWHSLGRRAGVNFSYLLFLDQIGKEPSVDDYRAGVKWLRLATDLPTFWKEWRYGRMRLFSYLSSLRGEKELAVFSISDPLPFFVEIIIAPYLKKKRGF